MTNRERQRKQKNLLLSLFAVAVGIVIIFPVIYGVATAFKTMAELSAYPPRVMPDSFANLENFRTVFRVAPIMRFMLNSVIVSGLGCVLRIGFAVLASYAFCYFKFPGRTLLFGIILGTMMLPADTLVVTNYLTVMRLNLTDNYFGLIVTSMVGAMQMFMLRQNFKTIPGSYRDAAFIDGCGDLRYLTLIVIPFATPVIMILLVQSFVSFWNMYLWPLLVTNRVDMRTVQIGVAMLSSPMDTNYTIVLAAVTLILIPSFILFIFLRMTVRRGIESGALVG
jgi:sn-glycerol 3-phosphate transport system permease protein